MTKREFTQRLTLQILARYEIREMGIVAIRAATEAETSANNIDRHDASFFDSDTYVPPEKDDLL